MAPRCLPTLAPFLYPSLSPSHLSQGIVCAALGRSAPSRRASSSSADAVPSPNDLPESRLNPAPHDYAASSFADKAELSLFAGRGGNGCISFQREAYLPDGPPNGGDGGAGGNIYIQAAHGETSLHKLARARNIRAGRGKNGQGSARGGTRGEDVVITVPVGTIVRELERQDPAADEAVSIKAWQALQKQRRKEQNRLAELERLKAKEMALQDDGDSELEATEPPSARPPQQDEEDFEDDGDPQRHKWLLYPGLSKTDIRNTTFPRLPRRRDRLVQQPPGPIHLDLTRPTPQPVLLAAGGVGGLGNPHFSSREHMRPVFATRGDEAVSMRIALELKLLADVGLVGLPNAGKSTLLRAMSNSRARVGSWAFTTLQPNIGTVVLDRYSGRPAVRGRSRSRLPETADEAEGADTGPRTRFTVADIPGLIEGAHLDRGLGIAFLRHVERAGVLAFVVDLAAGDAVSALDSLWREVGLYAQMREDEERGLEADSRIDWGMGEGEGDDMSTINLTGTGGLPGSPAPHSALQIAGKPWFVVATKADLPETQDNFRTLDEYLKRITRGDVPHPSGVTDAWTKDCAAVPVSAINGQGVDRIVDWITRLLDE